MTTPVLAQVTVDLHALQALPERSVVGHPSRATPPSAGLAVGSQSSNGQSLAGHSSPELAPQSPAASSRPAVATRQPTVVVPAAPPAAQPAMPETIPDTASIAPITPQAPPPGAQPPAPPPITDTSATAAAPTTTGLRLTFAPGESTLSPDSSTSIKQLTQAAPPGDATTFSVLAYAPGKADDPSTARRISLSRAMTVRSALVADGVPSARIFVRALGEQYGDGPPDRVDLSVTGATTAR